MDSSLIYCMREKGFISQATAELLNKKQYPSSYAYNEIDFIQGIPVIPAQAKNKSNTFSFPLDYLFGDGVHSLPEVLATLQSALEKNTYLDWSFGASPTFARSPLADYKEAGFAVRASPAIYTGEDTDTHWLNARRKKKFTQAVLSRTPLQVRPIQSNPNWVQLLTVSCFDYGTPHVATCMQIAYLEYIHGNQNYEVLDVVDEHGSVVAIAALYRATGSSVKGNVWQYQFLLKLRKEPLAREVALLCAQYLHNKYGDTLLDLTSDITMFMPEYQAYKLCIANCFVPLAVLDSFTSANPPPFQLQEPYLLDNRIVGSSRVLSVKDSPTVVDGEFDCNYPQNVFFTEGWQHDSSV